MFAFFMLFLTGCFRKEGDGDEGGSSGFSRRRGWCRKSAVGSLPGGREAYRSVLGIAMPAIAEMVLISLIGSLDTIMVGQLGKNALAAVSLPSQPRMMMLALFFALKSWG